MKMKESLLVSRLRAGDFTAIEGLFEHYGRAAYNLAYRSLQDATLAEEVVHGVFLDLWKNPDAPGVDGENIGMWLLTEIRRQMVEIIENNNLYC